MVLKPEQKERRYCFLTLDLDVGQVLIYSRIDLEQGRVSQGLALPGNCNHKAALRDDRQVAFPKCDLRNQFASALDDDLMHLRDGDPRENTVTPVLCV